ncbi:MAG: hypothetical protein WDA02_09545 [Saccharofermentanales bacterium]|jgi:hypothetical protein
MYIPEYRKIDLDTRKLIYKSYYEIINNLDINKDIRDDIKGILYENQNKTYVLKIYRPQELDDIRLTYFPIESIKIGKNSKTSIPFRIDTVKPFTFNVIDGNLYSDLVIDSNEESDNVIKL